MVSPKAYPLFNPSVQATFGGAEVDLYYLGTELAKDPAFNVSFLTADYGQAYEEERENVHLYRSLRLNQNVLCGLYRIWRGLARVNADIYMIKTPSLGVPLLQMFCALHGRHFVYRTASHGECRKACLKDRPVTGRLFIRAIRKASLVFTQKQEDHDALQTDFKIHSRVVPNGHRMQDVSDIKRDCILWVGRSVVLKQPRRFLELAGRQPAEKFVMICQRTTGDPSYEALRAEAAKVPNLTFIDHVRFDEIDNWFQRAKVFVNTSDFEGFPNTFIQACKAQTAILSFAVNPDGFLDRHHCGICAGKSAQRLDEGLQSLLKDGRYIELGRNGKQYAAKTHSIEAIAGVYKTCFTQLMKKPGGTGQ